jgi:nucleoside-diphosphate kinase
MPKTQKRSEAESRIMEIKRQQTLVLIKPDGVQRGLIGDVIGRFEKAGLKLVGMKMVWPSKELCEKHYTNDVTYLTLLGEKAKAGMEKLGLSDSRTVLQIGQWIRNQLGRYLSIGPVVAMVWQGTHAIQNVRQLVGSTNPITADVGSIRGDLTIDTIEMANLEGRSVRNLMHASSDPSEAKREIALWFSKSEIHEYENVMDKVLHDAEWDSPKKK